MRDLAEGDWTAPTRLDGSCAIILERGDEVGVIADLAGQLPIFYASTQEGRIVVGSQSRRVAAEIDAEVDPVWLVTRVLALGAVDVWRPGSAWRGVSSLRPGYVLRIRPDGSVTEERLSLALSQGGDLKAAAADLMRSLTQSIRHRQRGSTTPTVDLSGGLDSTTICTLLSENSEAPVQALTAVSMGVTDENYAVSVAAHLHGLRHETLDDLADMLPYSQLEQVPVLDEPAGCLTVHAREQWWLDEIAIRGSDLHFSGDGGDGVLMASPAYLADLAFPRRYGELWRHARGWSLLRHLPAGELLRAAGKLRRTSYPDALRATAAAIIAGGNQATGLAALISWSGPSPAAAWATPDARRVVADQLYEHAESSAAAPHLPGNFGIGDAVAWRSLTVAAREQRIYSELAHSRGVNHHAPFFDNGVIRACWSVSASVRTTPGQAKPLLQMGMAGKLPVDVSARRCKGDYTQLHYLGLKANVAELEEIISSARLADYGLINRAALRSALRQGVAGVPIPLGAFDMILATELWLRSLE